MKRLLLLVALSGSSVRLLSAANIPIVIVGVTETQIVVRYTATSSAFCSVTAVTAANNGGMNTGETTVHDLDPALFTNADRDLSRTYADGFRWPLQTIGLTRTVTIG